MMIDSPPEMGNHLPVCVLPPAAPTDNRYHPQRLVWSGAELLISGNWFCIFEGPHRDHEAVLCPQDFCDFRTFKGEVMRQTHRDLAWPTPSTWSEARAAMLPGVDHTGRAKWPLTRGGRR